MNTAPRNQWFGPCSWVPGPALAGRPGMTRKFFSTLLGQWDENFGFEPIFRRILRRVEVAFHTEVVADL